MVVTMPASDCQAATDPIQQMFADKVKEYAKKKAAAGGKLPDATKETEAAIAMELEKVRERTTLGNSTAASSLNTNP